jgi:catechol 2,3-dioxygenase-like lactoylglutathione lyase family enzyme
MPLLAAFLSFGVVGLASAAEDKVLGLAFVGREVSDLDASVAFYKAIGFTQDPLANPVWRQDEVTGQLYGLKGAVQTRMAKMYVPQSGAPGARFVVYLRELKGLPRKNLSKHTAWEPGATHFGLVVPDADEVWERLRASGALRARSWDAKLVAPPGEKGFLAYMTDPDGLDIELIGARPAVPGQEGRPGRAALVPGISHVGLIVLDSDKAKGFYGSFFGGVLQSAASPWMKGDFTDSAVGGHGNILRFFNESFAEAEAPPGSKLYLELVEFQNRKKPLEPAKITDIGVGYVGFQVQGLDAFLKHAQEAGASLVSRGGIVTMRTGTRVVMVRDPDVGMFIELFEEPPK